MLSLLLQVFVPKEEEAVKKKGKKKNQLQILLIKKKNKLLSLINQKTFNNHKSTEKDIINLLKSQPSLLSNSYNNKGETLLIFSITHNFKDLFDYLMTCDININELGREGKPKGISPLYVAEEWKDGCYKSSS